MTGPQNLSVDFLRTMLQEAAAVPLRAVREMQQEFIQAKAAMTQQTSAVRQESLRVQKSHIAQLAR